MQNHEEAVRAVKGLNSCELNDHSLVVSQEERKEQLKEQSDNYKRSKYKEKDHNEKHSVKNLETSLNAVLKEDSNDEYDDHKTNIDNDDESFTNIDKQTNNKNEDVKYNFENSNLLKKSADKIPKSEKKISPKLIESKIKIPKSRELKKEELYNLNDFVLERMIGSGKFGKVYRVIYKKTGEIYAAKISKTRLDEAEDDGSIIDLSREVNIISKLKHPSVLQFIFYSPTNFKKKPKPVIITEYVSNGSLKNFLHSNHSCNLTHKLIIIYGIASSMAYLHSHDIIHRDLKPDNILLDDFLFPKVADFGLSKTYSGNSKTESINTIKGTPFYIAPEIFSDFNYTKAGDVYAFGIILYEIFTNETPFNDLQNNYYLLQYEISKGTRPKFNKPIEKSYKDLIESCWEQDLNRRPTFNQILIRLKEDTNIITESVDKKEYFKYISYVDNCDSEFLFSEEFNKIKVNKLPEKNIIIPLSLKLFPYREFINLQKDESRNLVIDAEKDAEKQFIIGLYLIEGQNEFPHNVQLGINYLRESIKNGSVNSLTYFCKMLIKGKLIPVNLEKGKKLIKKYLNENDSLYLLLYGKIMKKEKKLKEAIDSFKQSMSKGNNDAIYEYAKMLFKTNKEEALKYFKMASENGNADSMLKYGKILIQGINNNQNKALKTMLQSSMIIIDDNNKYNKGLAQIKNAAEKGNVKAIYIYSQYAKNRNIKEYIKYLEMAANKGHILAIVAYSNFLSHDPNNAKEDFRLIKKASDKGNIEAIFIYGHHLYFGIGVQENRKEAIRYIRIAANNGYDKAMYFYASLLSNGIEVQIDAEMAVFYYKKAIEKGNIDAMNGYAYMLQTGRGIPINQKEAIKLYKMAINKGSDEAMNNYGYMLQHGEGIEVNKEEAIKYYKMAIEKGNIAAMNNYGIMLEHGDCVNANKEEALELYKKASENSKFISPAAMFNYANMLFQSDDISSKKEAIKYFKISINNVDDIAMVRYANILLSGDSVPVNTEEAIKLYLMAIDKKNVEAMVLYANYLRNNDSKEEAIKYYKMAIEKCDAQSMFWYAYMLQNGEGITCNKKEALKYYKMAADLGLPDAMTNYAHMLQHGEGIPFNKAEAAKYYKMAADIGEPHAMNNLALMLSKGDGIPMNKEEAIKYYKKAADLGIQVSMNGYAFMLSRGEGAKVNKEEAAKYYKMAADQGFILSMNNYAFMLL